MQATSTRVAGGTVQTPDGPLRADVLVKGERVVALIDRGEEADVDSTIDATDLWVLPGLIDLHAHTRVPGYEYKEDYVTASRAAAVGGVTVFVDMPNVEPPTTTVQLFEEKRAIADRDSIIDFGHFVAPTIPEEVVPMALAGATGFKIFQVKGGYPHDPRLAIDDPGRLLSTFRTIESTGLPCVVHPFAQTLFEQLSEEAFAAGRPRDIWTFSEMYTRDVVWRSAVGMLLDLQRETNVRLHVVHTHAAGSLRLIRAAKAEGLRVTAACDPKYIHLRDLDMEQQGARAIPGGFVTNDLSRMDEVWRSLDDATIDIIDSDHAPHTLEDLKLMEMDPWTGPFGAPHYDHYLSLLLTDVREGRIRLARLVELLSAAPARILGRYPERGAILPGSIADLIIVDPEATVVPKDGQMESKSGWTPYAGWTLHGKAVLTMLRGTVIVRDGEVTVDQGFGRYVPGRPLR
jgi:dihydroorotase